MIELMKKVGLANDCPVENSADCFPKLVQKCSDHPYSLLDSLVDHMKGSQFPNDRWLGICNKTCIARHPAMEGTCLQCSPKNMIRIDLEKPSAKENTKLKSKNKKNNSH